MALLGCFSLYKIACMWRILGDLRVVELLMVLYLCVWNLALCWIGSLSSACQDVGFMKPLTYRTLTLHLTAVRYSVVCDFEIVFIESPNKKTYSFNHPRPRVMNLTNLNCEICRLPRCQAVRSVLLILKEVGTAVKFCHASHFTWLHWQTETECGAHCSVSKIIPCSVFSHGRSRQHWASSRSLFFMPQQNPLLNHPEAIILDKDSHQRVYYLWSVVFRLHRVTRLMHYCFAAEKYEMPRPVSLTLCMLIITPF